MISMKIKSCHRCVVDPMCKVGCEQLWEYYESRRNLIPKIGRWENILTWSMVSMSVVWAALVIFKIVIPINTGHIFSSYTFAFFGLKLEFSYAWHLIPYGLLILSLVGVIVIKSLNGKLIHAIESGKRSQYIWQRESIEMQTEYEKKTEALRYKGGDITI